MSNVVPFKKNLLKLHRPTSKWFSVYLPWFNVVLQRFKVNCLSFSQLFIYCTSHIGYKRY